MAASPAQRRRPAAPVRRAFWLVVAAIVLLGAQTAAAAVLLARFAGAYAEHGPWSIREQEQIDSMHIRLALTVVLGAGMALLLVGVATAVPRRHTGTRLLVGSAALLAGVVLLLGVVVNPDNALLAYGAAEEQHLYKVLPLWFSALSSTAVTGVLAALTAAFVLLGRDAAHDYYQYHGPDNAWTGFSGWSAGTRRT
ncbi:hypothetical protein ACQEVZ_43110 [Dactylosporangium sp. CA-152071]|uniref:hypothetical protein n=1 Tax=Dactylosporangium sp. CA-152071 TaxID=3239933 RepID=UPI003D90112C